eukprot:TRINITY_DN10397_c0_g1_i4.p1 TRINITY_DN10397_c0_g1~~TRINITY_DN10397_c0_g1_i4.p1  ORF type:complete len:866 (+),score=196.81 TRINITY_DN10397_c0_g1_i4:3-2600(+)
MVASCIPALKSAVEHSLEWCLYDNACFLAERLLAEDSKDEHLLLLGQCYFRSGQISRAYAVLKACTLPKARYLFALCCYKLEKYCDGELALNGELYAQTGLSFDDFDTSLGAAQHLMGLLTLRSNRRKAASYNLTNACTTNPYMWSSFELLCELGEGPVPASIFHSNDASVLASMSLMQKGNPAMQAMLDNAGKPRALRFSSPMASQEASTPVQALPMETPGLQPLNLTDQSTGLMARGTRMESTPTSAFSLAGRPAGVPIMSSLGSPSPSFSAMSPRSRTARARRPLPDPKRKLPSPPPMAFETPEAPQPVSSSPREPGGQQPMVTPDVTDVTPEAPQPRRSVRLAKKEVAASKRTRSQVASYDDETDSTPAVVNAAATRRTATANVRRAPRQPIKLGFDDSVADTPPITTTTTTATSGAHPAPALPPALGRPGRLARGSSSSPLTTEATSTTRKPGRSIAANLLASLQAVESAKKAESSESSQSAEGATNQSAEAMMADLGESHNAAMELLLLYAQAWSRLTLYDCHGAIDLVEQMSPAHYHSGWSLCLMGKAFMELADYRAADRVFRMARRLESHRVDGMEYYSTVLWHMRKETDLAYLANEVMAADPHHPASWCVAGNCLSLAKDHDVAIKHFERAVQVDPTFAYAYTLLGHECLCNEAIEKAEACFRNAIRYNPRHYNAWYGLGLIANRQENLQEAVKYMFKAATINDASPILWGNFGKVLHQLGQFHKALKVLNKATKLGPDNPMVKYHRTVVLVSLDRCDEALQELELLRKLAPREPSVYFLLASVYTRLRQPDKAQLYTSWGIDLDPKASSGLKNQPIPQPSDDQSEIMDDIDRLLGPDEPVGAAPVATQRSQSTLV